MTNTRHDTVITPKFKRKGKILGQDPEILQAMVRNLYSWFAYLLSIMFFKTRNTQEEIERLTNNNNIPGQARCIMIERPGGLEELKLCVLNNDDGNDDNKESRVATIGYNVRYLCPPPFVTTNELQVLAYDENLKIMDVKGLPPDCVLLKNQRFSVNYADCCIRWGIYSSANEFVGWPIVPGFDVAGEVLAVGSDVTQFKVGEKVFGCTLFGAYSSRVIVPARQLRAIPSCSNNLTLSQACSLPAVSLTALYALFLAGMWPRASKYNNKAILIHSAAGGVGSMLVQMAKILKLHPIVGVVGASSKVKICKELGCDVVIDKSKEDLWKVAEEISPSGYSAIMDANGVSTLQDSYNHLCATGRVIVYGFHTNLPVSQPRLNPWQWIKMAKKQGQMPKFDPMDLCGSNKGVLGFNLSFFADEAETVVELFDQVCVWLNEGKLVPPNVEEFQMEDIRNAHALIQSGKSIGKIVLLVD